MQSIARRIKLENKSWHNDSFKKEVWNDTDIMAMYQQKVGCTKDVIRCAIRQNKEDSLEQKMSPT